MNEWTNDRTDGSLSHVHLLNPSDYDGAFIFLFKNPVTLTTAF